jgi:cytochrome P450
VSSPLDLRLRAFFASEPDAIADPFPLWAELRAAAPVYDLGPTTLVSRYADVRALARDGQRFSNAYREQGPRSQLIRASLPPEAQPAFDEVREFEANELSRTDGERHARLRAIAHRAFAPRRIAELEQATQRYVDGLLTELAEQEVCDLKVLAYAVPLQIISDLLGAPASDRELIHDWSNKLGRNRGGTEAGPLLEARDALREFRAYVAELIDRHRTSSDDSTDLAAALIEAERTDRMQPIEQAAMFLQLLFAGHETTTNLIGNGMLELLRAPDQWRRLVDDPSGAPAATEELMRFVSPVQFGGRLVLADVEIAGVPVAAGTTVVPIWASANRDPDAFERPDELDLGRPDARNHLGFGFGPHFCLGSSLARLEGATAFATIARRFPEIELAADSFAWTGNAMLRSVVSLPVALGRDHARPR